ncbi:hypothetical protein GGI09_000795 [Coemansia sp. S100]|nr:hypothetical protein LPJ71_000634 [Coemansia sp. S17]KAJ2103177.1 hypothetical protein GGI09_000795 [Coemansia sp. S100]KAJ2107316.1 hypothetical protein GGI16_001577 [Coemansia sp. S142-1]
MRPGFVGLCAAALLSGALGQGVAPTTNAQTPPSAPTGPTHAQTPLGALTQDDDDDDGWRASLSLPCPQATHQAGVTIDRVWGAHRCRGMLFVPRPTAAAPTWAVGSHASWPVPVSSIPPAWLIEEIQDEATPEATPQDGWPTEAAPAPLATEAAPTPSPRRYIGTFWPREGGQDLLPTEGTLTRSSTRYISTLWPWEDGQSPLPTEAATSPSMTDATPTARPTVAAQLTQSTQEDAFNFLAVDDISSLAVVTIGIAIIAIIGADLQRQPTKLPSDDNSGGDGDNNGGDGDGDAAPKGGAHPGESNYPQLPPVVERDNSPHKELNPPPLLLATERDNVSHKELNHPQLPPVVEHDDQRKESSDDHADKPGSDNDGDGDGNGAASSKESARPELLSSDAADASIGTDASKVVGSPITSSTPTPPETPHAGDNISRVDMAAQLAGPVPAARASSPVITETVVVAPAQPAADSGPGSTPPTRLNHKRKQPTRMPHPKRFNSDVPATLSVMPISPATTIQPSLEPVAAEPGTIGSLLDLVDAARRAARLAMPPPSSRDKGKAPVYTPAKKSTKNDSSNAAGSRDPPLTGSSRWHERRPAGAASQPDDSSDDEQTYTLTRIDKLVIMFSYLSVRDGEKFVGKAHADLQAQLGGGPGPVITSTGSILFGADNIDRLFTFAHDSVTIKSVQQAYAALCTGNRLQFADRARQMLHDIYGMPVMDASTPAQGDDSKVSRTHMLGFLDCLPVEDRRLLLHQAMMDVHAPQAAPLTTPIPQHATTVDMMSVIYTWSQDERQLFLDEAFARDDEPARDDEAFASDEPARDDAQHTAPVTEASGSSAQGGDNANIDEILCLAYSLTKDDQVRLFTLVLEGEQAPRTKQSTLVDEITAVVATWSDEDRQQFLSQLIVD